MHYFHLFGQITPCYKVAGQLGESPGTA